MAKGQKFYLDLLIGELKGTCRDECVEVSQFLSRFLHRRREKMGNGYEDLPFEMTGELINDL